MTKDEAKRLVARLRRWPDYGRTQSKTDLDLLRTLADAHENISWMFAIMMINPLCQLVSRGTLSWIDLILIGPIAFIFYCRWDRRRLRKAIRLFEDQGPQMVDDLKD